MGVSRPRCLTHNKIKAMKKLKTIACALLILACVGGSSTICLANDGTSITINGISPRNGIGSSLYTATSRDGDVTSCTWSITNPVKDDPTFTGALAECENHGKDCYLTFHSFGTVTLNCSATVDVKGSTKIQSGSREIVCKAPPNPITPTLKIIGEDLVSLNSEHEYLADYSAPKGVPRINWTYPGITANNVRDITLAFNNLGTFRLNCVLRCTDEHGNNLDPVSDYKDISVLPPVDLTALRASYENSTVANISGEEMVKIHYNIDDDDESYEDGDKYMGADCLQTAFKENNTNPDDDLCKLQISFGNDIDIDTLTEGTLYIEITKGLRLWKNNMRPNEDAIFLGKINTNGQIELSVALSLAIPEDKTKVRDILNNGLYVEGVAPGYGFIKIKFADKKLKLPYFCYAVGDPQDQPNPDQRSDYTNSFNLVDCEWCIKELSNKTYLDSYNCIAYAVDPRREVFDDNTASYATPFQGAFWVNPNEFTLATPGFDSWAENIWRMDPFIYEVHIALVDWYFLKTEYKVKFLDPNIAPYKIFNTNNAIWVFQGFSSAYRALLEDVLREHPGCMTLNRRFTTMAIFNRNPSSQDYTNRFFTLPDFAASIYNGHTLVECDTNDNSRIIMSYSIFHAARALSKTFDCRKFGKNTDPDWKMAVSKCGDSEELLIHREEQVAPTYGSVKKAYK